MVHISSLVSLLTLTLATTSAAQTTVGSPFADHMVIQAGAPVLVWGTDDAGAEVTVSFAGASAGVTAGDDGGWRVEFPAIEEAGPFEMTIEGSSSVNFSDVLVGDVWLCSGQSNMEWPVGKSTEAAEAAAHGEQPGIRLAAVPHLASLEPVDDADLAWSIASGTSSTEFSAVAYWFGRALQRETGRPIGLIESSWGGSPIRAWLPPAVSPTPTPDTLPGDPNKAKYEPTVLFNGMTHPLGPIALRGVIWYQGETDAAEPALYAEAWPRLVRSWREQFRDAELPVYFAQLAAFNPDKGEGWPAFREMQRKLAAPEGDHVDMAVLIDAGDPLDIHPRNKRVVGERLALLALADAYGQDVVSRGPLPREVKVLGKGKILVRFDSADGLHTDDGKPPRLFHVIDDGGVSRSVRPTIEGDGVLLTFIPRIVPSAVSYADEIYPEPNLFNAAGLPATPFRIELPREESTGSGQ